MGVYEVYLRESGFQVVPAATIGEARALLRTLRPAAVILDILLPDGDGFALLAELRAAPATRDLPVIVGTVSECGARATALGALDYAVKPVERRWLLARLAEVAAHLPSPRVLLIDDSDTDRYLFRLLLAGTQYEVLEAASGDEGLRRAVAERPDVIFLDLVMPGLSGFDVLDQLKADERTRAIPVVVQTSKVLDAEERRRLAGQAAAFVFNDATTREAALARIRDALQTARPDQGRGA